MPKMVLSFLFFCSCQILFSGDGPLRLNGFSAARATHTGSADSWLEGGNGRLIGGDNEASALVQLGLDWEPNLYFQAHLHGLARTQEGRYGGEETGLTEAWIQARAFVGDQHRFRFKLGMFFPPTSQDNIEEPWASPYTQTLSSINSWIAEEQRYLGLDLSYSKTFGTSGVWFVGASLLTANDTAGALLAWRGWAMHDRLTVLGETLPLPPLSSLVGDSGAFGIQRPSGTKTFGTDLDNRPGYAARSGLFWGEDGELTLSWSDNRGDRGFHGWDYAWHTLTRQLGVTVPVADHLVLLGEVLDGSTGMGLLSGPHVQMGFTSWYLMGSLPMGNWRFSTRFESFETRDRDGLEGVDLNDEDGQSWTFALFWKPQAQLRVGLEWLDMDLERPVDLADGPTVVRGGNSWSLELRYFF